MLYQLIFPDADADTDVDFHSNYDNAIQSFLKDTPPGGLASRQESLVLSWDKKEAGKKLTAKKDVEKDENDCNQNEDDKEGGANKKTPYQCKLEALQAKEALFTTNRSPSKLSIDDLTNRANKLADLRSVVARMNRDLSRLMEDLATGLQCHGDGTNTQ